MPDLTPVFVAAGAILAAFVGIRWLVRETRRSSLRSSSGYRVLRTNRCTLGIGLGLMIGGPVLLAAVVRSSPLSSKPEFVAFWIVLCAFLVSGASLVVPSVGRRIEFDSVGIALFAWGRSSVRLRWKDVSHMRFRGLPASLVLEGSCGQSIRISLLMGGVEDLLAQIEGQMSSTISEPALANSRQFLAGFARRL